MSDVLVEKRGHVTLLTINRPDRMNAFTSETIEQLLAGFEAAQADDNCRAVVLTGAGRAFCAGADGGGIGKERSPLSSKEGLWNGIQRLPLFLDRMDKPVIAAVNGAAVGAGCDIALMCDIRTVGESGRFSEGYVRVGLVPGEGGAYFLPRLVGPAMALELLWTGDFVAGPEAVNLGLANHCYPDDELLQRTLDLAARIAAQPPIVVRYVKRAVRQCARTDLPTALDLISSHMAVVRGTEDTQEALRAFKAKERPAYHGR
jgi:2-(1,2-epoxy-1,2-dihydrophenyl)acetyl-CoA isomerase